MMTVSRETIRDRLERAEQRAADRKMNRLENRLRYLPHAIRTTREKLAALEREAREFGMIDLLESGR